MTNEDLVHLLIEDGYLKTPEIIESFQKIDRADFVIDEQKNFAYENIPLPIGFDQTISQPLTVAFMLELLYPKAGEKVLDIGSGSGWQTALIADLVGKNNDLTDSENNKGLVVAIERISLLKEMTEQNVAKYNFINKGIVKVIFGDGIKGYKNDAPYDKIIAAASAKGEIPVAWKRQLKIGGRIVAPVESSILVIDKISKNKYNKKEYFGFSFVPLLEGKE